MLLPMKPSPAVLGTDSVRSGRLTPPTSKCLKRFALEGYDHYPESLEKGDYRVDDFVRDENLLHRRK